MKATALLIDDAQLERKMNEWTLMHAGYKVITAKSGEEGLSLAITKLPDVILLDPVLPDINGHQLLVELKTHSQTTRIPVIILSSASQLDAVRFRREGAAEYLQKDKVLAENSSQLIAAVESVLHPVL